MFRSFSALVFFLGSVFITSNAHGANPFEITGVHIDSYGSNVIQARQRAISAGTVTAAYQLMDRLTLPEDRIALIPPLMITPEVAEGLVASIEIANEKRSSTRYLGDLEITFDAQLVRSFMHGNGLPFVESQSVPILVIALWQQSLDAVTGGANNPFAREWAAQNIQNQLVPIKLLNLGEGSDGVKNAWKIARLHPTYFNKIVSDAGFDEAVVAFARPVNGTLIVSVKRIPLDGFWTGEEQSIGYYEEPLQTDLTVTQAQNQALKTATAKISEALQNEWKRSAIVRSEERQSVRLTALYSNMQQWQQLSDAFGSVSLVEEARLDALGRDGALLTLSYVGNEDQLALHLAQKGVILRNEDIGLVARIR